MGMQNVAPPTDKRFVMHVKSADANVPVFILH